MPAKLYAGPYDFISIGTVKQAPWYVIPFDDRGRCTGPLTRDHLVRSVMEGSFTDIYLFSHGWNNDWRGAVGDDPSGVASGSGYRGMIDSYMRLRQTRKLTYSRDYNPLLIGIFWPSTWLVFPWEQAPDIAADDPQLADATVDQERRTQEEIARLLDDKDIEAFYTYIQQEQISEGDARELARIMLPLYQHHSADSTEDRPIESPASEEQLVELWRTISQPQKPLDTGDEGGLLGGVQEGLEIAGGSDSFDPRMIIRGASVWLMKDRAGVVGARGVSNLLIDLLKASDQARLHVIGHSFGCRVLLSAICYPAKLPGKVNSALLIQPAVSHLCFATDVTGSEKPGGYRAALDRVEQPILLTFTEEDQALHDWFHRALIRPSDLGEAEIAGDDEPPSAFAALGGYGPRGCAEGECAIIPIKQVGDAYNLETETTRIYALNSIGVIRGHSDFNKDATWWALYNQIVH